jgi:pilus assembly protein CpaE
MPVARVRQRAAPAPRSRAGSRWRGRCAADDRGSASVEFTILFPIIVVLVLGGPQLVMWYFAREAAQSAAAAAARAASVVGAASDGAGRSAATSYLGRVGKDTIASYIVDESDTATSVTIHIHVTVPTVIPLPGFTPSADVTVTRGKERFTTPDSP